VTEKLKIKIFLAPPQCKNNKIKFAVEVGLLTAQL